MISINALLLIIQICIFLSFPIFRIILLKFFFDDEKLKKIYVFSYLAFNLIITISFLSYFLYSYFTSSIEPLSVFQIYESPQYNIEFGFHYGLIQVFFYSAIFLALPFILNYLTLINPKLGIKHLERIFIISVLGILLVFSPNFLQFLAVYLVLDILVIDFVNISITGSKHQKKNKINSLVFSFILGNIFIFTSSTLLIRRSHSFDFSIIENDIMFKFILSNPYFRNLCLLLIFGIIIKCSLFPFHNWKSEICKKNNEWLFLILNVYMLFSLFTLFGTPFVHILYIVRNFLTWFGLTIAFFSVVINVLLNEGLDNIYLLQSSFIGFIFISVGTGLYSAALHQVSVMPFVFSILLILISIQAKNNKNKKLEDTKFNVAKSLIIFSSIILVLFPLIGVIPFNSVLLTLIYSFDSSNLVNPVGLLSLGLLTLLLTFLIGLIFIRRIWNKRKKMVLSSNHKFTILPLILIFILTCSLFPIFFLHNFLPPVLVLNINDYLISVIPLTISYFVIGLLYFITAKFYIDFNIKLDNFFIPVRAKIRTLYYFDFIFYATNWCWLKSLKPLLIWIYDVIIVRFLYQIIIKSIFKFISKVLSIISISLTDYLYPFVKSIFVSISEFFIKLEYISLRRQLQLAVIFIFAILLTFVIYYVGGTF